MTQTANEFGYDSIEALFYICGEVSKGDAATKCVSDNAKLFEAIDADFVSRFKVIDVRDGWGFWQKNGLKIIPVNMKRIIVIYMV